MIRVSGLNKTFRVSRRKAGFGNALRAFIRREYNSVQALRDVSFNIHAGEMVGYIGPNGAGKSTTIKILCGILTPDSGECEVNGLPPWRDRRRHVRDIGVVFGQRSQLWWDVPVIDSFELLKDIYRLDTASYKRTLDELTGLLGLSELLETPTRSLSLGQRMRCEIAASLIHRPKILFLDEPTIGLDAVSKIAVREFIKKQNREFGTTVILTTHDMQDIEALAQRILLIGRGRILLDGSLRELKKRFSGLKTITVEYEGSRPVPCQGMKLIKDSEGQASFSIDTDFVSISQAISHISGTAEIRDLSVEGAKAEDMVVELYKEYRI